LEFWSRDAGGSYIGGNLLEPSEGNGLYSSQIQTCSKLLLPVVMAYRSTHGEYVRIGGQRKRVPALVCQICLINTTKVSFDKGCSTRRAGDVSSQEAQSIAEQNRTHQIFRIKCTPSRLVMFISATSCDFVVRSPLSPFRPGTHVLTKMLGGLGNQLGCT
jgi:hypothetical protein